MSQQDNKSTSKKIRVDTCDTRRQKSARKYAASHSCTSQSSNVKKD